MTYEEWRQTYNSQPLMNEAMAEAAWKAATAAAQERFADALANACVAAEIPDSKYESLLIALKA